MTPMIRAPESQLHVSRNLIFLQGAYLLTGGPAQSLQSVAASGQPLPRRFFCRNLHGEEQPWCYVGEGRRETCDLLRWEQMLLHGRVVICSGRGRCYVREIWPLHVGVGATWERCVLSRRGVGATWERCGLCMRSRCYVGGMRPNQVGASATWERCNLRRWEPVLLDPLQITITVF